LSRDGVILPLSYLLPLPDKGSRVGFRTLKNLYHRPADAVNSPYRKTSLYSAFVILSSVKKSYCLYTNIYVLPYLTPSNVVRFKKLRVAQLHKNIPL